MTVKRGGHKQSDITYCVTHLEFEALSGAIFARYEGRHVDGARSPIS